MKSLKILVFNWRDPLHSEAGGAEIHMDRILTYLATKHEVILVSTRTCAKEEIYMHNGYTVQKIGHPQLFHLQFSSLWKRFQDQKFDCIIDDISKIGLQIPKYIKHIPVLSIFHHVHGHTLFQLLPFPMSLYVFWAERTALKTYRYEPMVVVSDSTKDELLKLGNYTDITVLPNGIDSIYLQVRDRKKIPFQFCSLGRLTKAKRVDLSIEYFAEIHKIYPHSRLLIAGKGTEEDKLKKLAVQKGLGESVEFLGFVSEEQKIELLTKSEAMLFTSEKEGWGITAMEASACGTPVLGFDVSGIRDSVRHGVNGYLSPYADKVRFLENAFNYLQTDQVQKDSFQARAYCYAQNFSWDKIVREFELLILNLVYTDKNTP